MRKRIAKAVLFWYRNASEGGKVMTNITKHEMETIVNYNAGEESRPLLFIRNALYRNKLLTIIK